MADQVVNFPRDTTMTRMADAQEKTNEILAAIAAGSAGAAYTDTVFAVLLDGTNTTDIFWQWWPLSDGEGETRYHRLERFALMLQRAWGAKIYTLRFSLGSTTTGTPQDDLAGRSAAPLATDSSTPEEDWAVDDPMTWYIRANAQDKADGTMDVLALEGEDGFDVTGETAPVYTFRPSLLRKVWTDSQYKYKSWTLVPKPGYAPYAANVAPDGSRRHISWQASFPGVLDANGALTSGAGKRPNIFTSPSTGLTQARKQTAYSALATDADVIVLLDQWQLRHFDKENSRIAEGCTSYSWQYKAAAAENGVRRFLVTSTQAANILVGSTVFVGDPGSNSNLDRGQSYMRSLADRVRVLSIETVEVGDQSYSAVNLDMDEDMDVTATSYISSAPWYSGETEKVPGHHDGSPGSNTSGKYPVRIAGCEVLTGAYHACLDPVWNAKAESDGGLTYHAMVCRDGSKQSGSATTDRVEAASHTFASGEKNKWNYIKDLDEGSTESLLPAAVGGSETTYYKSAFYCASGAGVCCPWRFGNLYHYGYAGLANAHGNNGPGSSGWSGAPWLAGSGKTRGEWSGSWPRPEGPQAPHTPGAKPPRSNVDFEVGRMG